MGELQQARAMNIIAATKAAVVATVPPPVQVTSSTQGSENEWAARALALAEREARLKAQQNETNAVKEAQLLGAELARLQERQECQWQSGAAAEAQQQQQQQPAAEHMLAHMQAAVVSQETRAIKAVAALRDRTNAIRSRAVAPVTTPAPLLQPWPCPDHTSSVRGTVRHVPPRVPENFSHAQMSTSPHHQLLQHHNAIPSSIPPSPAVNALRQYATNLEQTLRKLEHDQGFAPPGTPQSNSATHLALFAQ